MKGDKENMEDFDFHVFSIIIFLLTDAIAIIWGEKFLRVFIPKVHIDGQSSQIWEVSPVFLLYEKIICDEKYEVLINTELFRVTHEKERSIM